MRSLYIWNVPNAMIARLSSIPKSFLVYRIYSGYVSYLRCYSIYRI